MANGPNIQGEVNLDTKDLEKAIKQIKQLERSFAQSSTKLSKSTDRVSKSIGQMAAGLGASVSGSSRASAAARGLAGDQDKLSGSSDRVKSSITSNINAINKAEIAYQKLEARIRASALEDNKKEQEIRETKVALDATVKSIDVYGSRSSIAAKKTADFRKRITSSGIAVAGANRAFRGQAIADFRTKMQNLTSSVQLALGPLSGVASRLTALAGLFNRNAAAVASLFGAMTVLSITFSRSMKASLNAETTYLRTESVLKSMGGTAAVTSDQIMEMGSNIAMATLTSTQEARSAAVALAGFGGITADSFERIITTAQGMSEQFGGDLVSNTKYLARALQDPERRLTSLERKIGTFNTTVKEQVESLIRSGDATGAQALILEELSDKYDLATDAAAGLAGSLDTTSELATKLYERLGLASGATAEAAKQVNQLNERFREFIDSDSADAIGRLFLNTAKNIGRAINFLADNADTLALIFNALLGGVILRLFGVIGRLLKPLGQLTLGFGKMGVAAATGGKAVKGMAAAFGTLNPYILALKAAAIIATPLLGGLIAKFVTSGDAAKSATPEIDKYTKSLEGILETSKALAEWSPSLLIDAAEVAKTKHQLEGTGTVINELQNQINTLESKGINSELRAMALQANVSFSEIKQNAKVFGEVLQGSLDISDAPNELQDSLSSLLKASNSLFVDNRSEVVRYLNTLGMMPEAKLKADVLTEGLKEQEASLKATNEVVSTFAQEVKELTTLTSNLAETFDKEHNEIRDLKGMLNQAVNAHDFFATASAAGGEKSEEFATRAETLRRVIENLSKELDEALNKNRRITDSYKDIADSIKTAKAMLANFKNVAAGGKDLSDEFEIGAAVRKARSEINDLNENELNKLGTDFNLIQGLNEGTEEFKARVKDAYGAFVAENMKATKSVKDQIDAQKELKDFFDSNASTIDQLRKKYQELYGEAFTANASQDQIEALRDRFDQEKAVLREQSKEMADFATGLSTQQIATERESRMEALKEMWGAESEAYKEHLAEMNDAADRSQAFASFGERAQAGADMVTSAMDTMKIAQREQTESYKNFARAQILLSSGVAIAKAIEQGMAKGGNLALGLAQAALVSAKMGAQLASINSVGFADGGFVSGKGTSKSDSIPARLSDGEYVINAAAVRKLGMRNLDLLNTGEMPKKFSEGGLVSPIPMTTTSGGSGGSQVNVQVIDQRSNKSAPIETEESMTPDGIRSIRILVRDTVNEVMNTGGTDRAMAQNYGVSRRPKKR